MIKRTQDVNNKKNTRGSDGKRSTLLPVATRRRKVRLSDISRYRHLQQQSNKENEYKGSTRVPKKIIIVTTLRSDNVKKYICMKKSRIQKRESQGALQQAALQ